jgi:hypothetical protein
MKEQKPTKKEEEYYDQGVQDGFNHAAHRVMEALGIDLEKLQEEKPKEEEFLNKP